MNFSSDWTQWTPLLRVVSSRLTDHRPAAYVIRVRGSDIARAVGVDSAGILDVGETNNLRTRLSTFLRCATSDAAGHMAGIRYAYLGLARHFPPDELDVRWQYARTKQEAVRLEGWILSEYTRRHFELPPLNYKYNWSND